MTECKANMVLVRLFKVGTEQDNGTRRSATDIVEELLVKLVKCTNKF